jgi:hypothetical protein
MVYLEISLSTSFTACYYLGIDFFAKVATSATMREPVPWTTTFVPASCVAWLVYLKHRGQTRPSSSSYRRHQHPSIQQHRHY